MLKQPMLDLVAFADKHFGIVEVGVYCPDFLGCHTLFRDVDHSAGQTALAPHLRHTFRSFEFPRGGDNDRCPCRVDDRAQIGD